METLISDMELVQSNAQIQGDAELERELARLREFGNQGAEKKTSLKKLFPRKKKDFYNFFFLLFKNFKIFQAPRILFGFLLTCPIRPQTFLQN
jgi:hypothetical protein